MDSNWFNIRFGERHFILGPGGLSFKVNTYHTIERYKNRRSWKWFEIYTLFGRHTYV